MIILYKIQLCLIKSQGIFLFLLFGVCAVKNKKSCVQTFGSTSKFLHWKTRRICSYLLSFWSLVVDVILGNSKSLNVCVC